MRDPSPTTVVAGVLAIALVTSIAGFYVPLRRQHAATVAQLNEARRESERLAERLAESERKPAPPAARATPPPARVARTAPRGEHLGQALRQEHAAAIAQRKALVSWRDERVSLAMSSASLFEGAGHEVSAGGRRLLCNAIESVRREFRGEVRVAGYASATRVSPAGMAKGAEGPWLRSALRAASVVETLERHCEQPPDGFISVGYGPRAPGPLGENVAFEIQLPEEAESSAAP